MKLVVLGSGTSVPHPQRAAPAFWLETATGSVLLDCGPDATHRMAQERVDWSNLDAVWISHLHLDHCGGLAALLFGLKWAPQTAGRTKPLKIFGCQGIGKLLRAIDQSNNYKLFEQRFPIELQEVPGGGSAWDSETPSQPPGYPREVPGPLLLLTSTDFEMLPGLRARTFSTPHTRESLALRLTAGNGASLVYSSDTGYSEELAIFAHGARLLILECSFWRNKPTPKHLELTEAMRIALLAEPSRLLLTHLYPEWDGVDLESKSAELWVGETVGAYDGLRIDIGP